MEYASLHAAARTAVPYGHIGPAAIQGQTFMVKAEEPVAVIPNQRAITERARTEDTRGMPVNEHDDGVLRQCFHVPFAQDGTASCCDDGPVRF